MKLFSFMVPLMILFLASTLAAKEPKTYLVDTVNGTRQYDFFGIEQGSFSNGDLLIGISCTSNIIGSDEMTFVVVNNKKKNHAESFSRDIRDADRCVDDIVDMIRKIEAGEKIQITAGAAGITYKTVEADLDILREKIKRILEEYNGVLSEDDKRKLFQDLIK